MKQKTNLELAMMCNLKEITLDDFKSKTGQDFSEFWDKNKKECLREWRNILGIKKREVKEVSKKAKREENERIKAYRLEYKKPKPQKVPVSIQQLAEIHVMASRGEITIERFAQAFQARFPNEILKAKRRIYKESNYGWDTIDWKKLEAHPLLSQLIIN